MSRNAVLLVEDEPLIALNLQLSLEDEGYTVHYAANGREALGLLEDGALALAGLVTDIRCGGGPSGWEIACRARAVLPKLAVIYVTGDCAIDHARLGVPHSIMVPKPFHVQQIVSAIGMLLPQ